VASEMPQLIAPLPEDEWEGEVRARLGVAWVPGVPPSKLRTTLARHTELFPLWDEFGSSLLRGDLPARDREILILRTVYRAGGVFEWAYHEPIARRLGMTDADVQAIVRGPDDPAWDDYEAALLRAADEFIGQARLSPSTWAALSARLSDKQLIEVLLVAGLYLKDAFITNTLGIDPPEHLPKMPRGAGPPPPVPARPRLCREDGLPTARDPRP
jgi:4-carboxymuconolactone decarboxylase